MITLQKEKLEINDVQLTYSPYQIEQRERYAGRPIFCGKNESEVVAKLQYAFSIGAKSLEACCFADISTDSFYRYCRRYPEFRNKIELLQATPILIARVNIFKAIANGNLKLSWKYLETHRPEEFTANGAIETRIRELQQRVNHLEDLLRENDISF
jgi:hypothetical protein